MDNHGFVPAVFGPVDKETTTLLKKLEDSIKAEAKAQGLSEESVCQEAHRIVSGERDQSYGTALSNFTRIAKLWSVVLKVEVTPEQVGLCMALVKFAREVNKHKKDNLVDAAGYLQCVQTLIDERAQNG